MEGSIPASNKKRSAASASASASASPAVAVPQWLDVLLKTKFFESCDEHEGLHKGEKNIYCVDCYEVLCQNCPGHLHRHRRNYSGCRKTSLLQIRRYVYNDVVKVGDLHNNELLDCSKIQTYSTNGHRVIHLNPKRQQTKPPKNAAASTACVVCGCFITEPNRFCSIFCKVTQEPSAIKPIAANMEDPADGAKSRPLGLLASSDPEEPLSEISSPSNTEVNHREEKISEDAPIVAATADVAPIPSPNPTRRRLRGASRRKGTPHRAPFF